jgi:hypothetical protein
LRTAPRRESAVSRRLFSEFLYLWATNDVLKLKAGSFSALTSHLIIGTGDIRNLDIPLGFSAFSRKIQKVRFRQSFPELFSLSPVSISIIHTASLFIRQRQKESNYIVDALVG